MVVLQAKKGSFFSTKPCAAGDWKTLAIASSSQMLPSAADCSDPHSYPDNMALRGLCTLLAWNSSLIQAD